ncbi:MAG: RHS repeat-associated core domain-containing protein [Cytophagales bacterium]|nr:RHS repeat-associated core domain-containing protein [Cytophagales bacterium]
MACPKLLYDHDQESLPFLEVWKKERLENTDALFLGTPGEKSRAENFCDSYLPFGGTFNSSATSPENLYKYNGKEEQKETGWYDYGARMQDPWLGRWFNIDPLAGKYYQWSPYTYTLNNPIRFVDPDGMQVGVEKEGDQDLVRNSVSQEESQYIKFNKNGQIKRGAIRRGAKKLGDNASENFTALNALVQSDDSYMVVTSDEVGDFGSSEHVATDENGESGAWGPTFEVDGEVLLGKQGEFRPQGENGNESGHHLIMINKGQSEDNQTVTQSHEAYGHAYFFDKGEDAGHDFRKEWETDENGDLTGNQIRIDQNKKLDKQIKKVEKNTRRFLKQRRGK